MAQSQSAMARPANGHGPAWPEPQSFSVPARHNPRLQAVVERLGADDELRQLWRCANVNAVDRLGLGDSGEVHARIVANAALKLLRLLRDAGEMPSVVDHYRLGAEDAEVVVVLAAALHELGLAAGSPAGLGLALPALKARETLSGLYAVREQTILLAETLHAIAAAALDSDCLTLEAGVLRLADALDMTKGRVRLPLEGAGPAVLVDEVRIQRQAHPPVRVVIGISAATAAPQVAALLRARPQPVLDSGWAEVVIRLGDAAHGPVVPLEAPPASGWVVPTAAAPRTRP